ncbi:NnrS family protein [uncultured Campylobacter sp.]|uniref:NnrS family protein n=1 Tax=uncultured Campylobacter sp. TaxID=218934 RepID=UPI0026023F24|nr:NnrS family protein [uncultured Campylobacter sp.]
MSRNFIFNARKQGGSARNLNLRCGLGASKRSFGAYRDPVAFGHGLLQSAEYCDLGARRHGFLQSTKCRDVSAGGHSLSQDIGRCDFITPKYELRSRANCDYSVSVLLNGAVCCGFATRNSTKFSSDTYCGYSESIYLRCSSSVSACLRRVGANRGVHSRRDPARLQRSSSTSGRLQSSMGVRSQRNFNAGICLQRVGTKQGVHLYCKFGANRDAFSRCGFDTCGLSVQFSAQKAVFSAYRSLFCDASGLGSEQNLALDTFCAVRNFLNLHVARDFNNFGSINLKKFDLAALQFANLKKQIRADKNFYKSAEPHNLTSFGRETRTPGRSGFKSKILATHGFLSEGAVGASCGPSLGYRNCEFAQNSKVCASDFTRNFKNSARDREAEPAQSFKDQNLAQDFSQNGKSYDQNSTQGFSQSGRSAKPNSKPSFSQNIKNSERNLPLSFLQSVKSSDQSQNSKPASAQNFKNQNFAWDFSQNGRSAEPNSVQNFSQSSKNSDRNSKANSTQNQTEPVSSQELKNSDRNFKANSTQDNQAEPNSAGKREELGFYAPKFKDERARNFFSHPMRAFVLCACFFAALGALSFLAPDALAIDYVGAHKFYFLFLAPSCIYAAFLLTALPDWTNFEGSLKPVSLAFAACLIAAFIASFLNLRLAAAITALFWAIFFIFAARLLWLDKNSNNFSILAVLAAFCACSAAYGASGDEKFLLSFVHINVAAIAVVSYRISVVIGNEALREGGLKDAVFIPNFIYKNLAAFLAFALALATPFLSEATCGFIALGIGFLFLAKLRELHYVEILSRHYMAFYYALQAACAAGYLWLGAALIRGGYAAAPLHVIAICYIYGAILFVGMIAGQRHSGISPLNFPRLSRAALVLALLAGILRAVFAGENFVLYVMIPSALFIAAVALYLINFVPIFLKNPFSADPD